jgi:threonine dehydrogenase-like Zn-dependent dehydrogenase
VLVTGAGPIGLLAAMMARQRGFELDVLDLATDGPKPQLVRDLGGHYHTGKVADLPHLPDITIECTGAPAVVLDVMRLNSPCGIVCLAGVSSGGRTLPLDVGGLNQSLVLENDVIFGTVNANRRHYEAAAKSLAEADRSWLSRLITRRVPLERWHDAITKQPHDVKVVIDFQEASASH